MHYVEIVSQLEDQHLPQVRDLIEAATTADGHEPLGEHKFLRLRRGDDLAGAVLAFDDGRIAGYAHSVIFETGETRRASCEFVVHPDYRRRGIGTSLLEHAVAQARCQGVGRFDVWAYNHNHASEKIATDAGFRPGRRLLHLHRHVSHAPVVAAPAGSRIRPFLVGCDEERWLALNARIFSSHPENGVWTRGDLSARMAQPWFDPEDLLMLEVDGEPAGFCWLKVAERGAEGRVGEIYVIGTVPEVRGRGIGKYLLAQGLARLADRAVDVVAIYVDESNRAAVALYDSAGFHHHHVDVCYTRELKAAAGDDGERAAA